MKPSLSHLVGAICLSLTAAACGGSADNSATPTTEAVAETTAAPTDSTAAPAANSYSVPADIAERGTLKIATSAPFPPMELFDEDGTTLIGFDIDVATAIATELGLTPEFENTTFDGLLGGLDAGRSDMVMASMVDKAERHDKAVFVNYLQSGVSFLVASGNPDKIMAPADMCGKTVAVEKSSLGDTSVDDFSKACTDAGSDAIEKLQLATQAEALQALSAKRAQAVVALDVTLAYNASQSEGAFEVPAGPLDPVPLGIAIKPDNTELRDAVQAALKALQDNGEYDKILAKWNLEAQTLPGATINAGA